MAVTPDAITLLTNEAIKMLSKRPPTTPEDFRKENKFLDSIDILITEELKDIKIKFKL